MSNERDELAALIRANRTVWVTNSEHEQMEAKQAEAILEAGYRKAPEPEIEWAILFGCGDRSPAGSKQDALDRMPTLEAAEGTCLPLTLVQRRRTNATYSAWEPAAQ